MKIFTLILILILSKNLMAAKKLCTLDILRSFGYHSLITPNRSNKLCPSIKLNCCTKHDQMKMHKTINSKF